MPAQFDLFSQPVLPAVSAQLSLFAEDAGAEAGLLESNALAGKKPRKRATKKQSVLVRERGTSLTFRLFDECDAAGDQKVPDFAEPIVEVPALFVPALTAPVPPPSARAAKFAPSSLPPLTLPFGDDEDEDETSEPSYRVLFDSTVWALRPDSGDFIHVGTGEVRDEDSFTFPTDLRTDYSDTPDDWDVPQVRP